MTQLLCAHTAAGAGAADHGNDRGELFSPPPRKRKHVSLWKKAADKAIAEDAAVRALFFYFRSVVVVVVVVVAAAAAAVVAVVVVVAVAVAVEMHTRERIALPTCSCDEQF